MRDTAKDDAAKVAIDRAVAICNILASENFHTILYLSYFSVI
jgi:hypothetical protein